MKNSVSDFGKDCYLITLTNEKGNSVSVTNAGAALVSFVVGGRDTVLGYNSGEHYLSSESYQGEFVGRYAGRIGNARFSLNGKEYKLFENTNGGSLHGGKVGFSHRLWDISLVTADSVMLSLFSEDGDEGYPGNLSVDILYRFNEENELTVKITAECDADTVFNPTLHPYFNLNENQNGTVLNHLLKINADNFTPFTESFVPDGTLLPVENTPYDFRKPKPVSECVFAAHPQVELGAGLDMCFSLSKGFDYGTAATLCSEDGRLALEITTDRPAAVIYSANWLDDENGKYGPLFRHQGLAMEMQMFPNSVNVPTFPSTVLKKGEKYESVTVYKITERDQKE